VSLEEILGRGGMVEIPVLLLFNNASNVKVYNWLMSINHCSFTIETVSHPSLEEESYNNAW